MSSNPYYRPDFDEDDYNAVKVPDVEDEKHDLMYGIRELIKSRPFYQEAERQFKGFISVSYDDPRLNSLLQNSADRRLFNLASVPVKHLANHVKLSGIKFVEDAAQEAWNMIWEANNLIGWAHKAHKETFKLGDYYAMVWPVYDETDDGETDDDVLSSGVMICFLDPKNVRKIYDKHNPRIEMFDIQYWAEGKRMRADLIYRDRIEHYITRDHKAKGFDKTDWEEFVPEYPVVTESGVEYVPGEAVEENPFGELPIKHFATDLPYGSPINQDGYGAFSAISELLVSQMSTITAQGWPARFALEDTDFTLGNNSDSPNFTDFEDPLDNEDRATTAHQIRSEPGSLTVLQGIRAIQQLLPADPKVFTDPVELYMSLASVLTDTPFYAFKPGGEQPSGKAREIADAPRRAQEEYQKALLERTWKEIAKLSLRMVGFEDVGEINIKWAPSSVATDRDDWDVISAKVENGVPFDVVMVEAGYDPETVDDWSEKLQEYSLNEQVEIVTEIATMMGQLGSSVKAGILSREDAHKVVSELLDQMGISVTLPPEPAPEPEIGVMNDGSSRPTDRNGRPQQLGGGGKPPTVGGNPSPRGPGDQSQHQPKK